MWPDNATNSRAQLRQTHPYSVAPGSDFCLNVVDHYHTCTDADHIRPKLTVLQKLMLALDQILRTR